MDKKSLDRLYRQLKREYPELAGLGIGMRKKGGKYIREPALRLVVAKKKAKGSRSYRMFPKEVSLQAGRGRRPLTIRIHTDVEEVGEWVPTSFPLLLNGQPAVTAACYARWKDPEDRPRSGVVTVAHAFQSGQSVEVAVAGGVAEGRVYLRSDLARHGLDVGLVEIRAHTPGLRPCLPAPLNPGAPSESATIGLLGLSDTDALHAPMENWHGDTPAAARALAFYTHREIRTPDGQGYTLKSVVFADGPPDTFARGRSGSPWVLVSSDWNPLAVALQSHGHEGRSFRLGLGTHFATALRWLNKHPSVREFGWAWRFEDFT